jgi:hypothetical protein
MPATAIAAAQLPTGHDARPDVLHLEVNRRRLATVGFDE